MIKFTSQKAPQKEKNINMFAVIKTGGKQYKVAENDVILVEKLDEVVGSSVELSDVLMLGEAGKVPKIGSSNLNKATVFAEVIEQSRSEKIIVFKKKRRHNYRRKAGHRQDQTVLRITSISLNGVKPKTASKKSTTPKKTASTKKVSSSKKLASSEKTVTSKKSVQVKKDTIKVAKKTSNAVSEKSKKVTSEKVEKKVKSKKKAKLVTKAKKKE